MRNVLAYPGNMAHAQHTALALHDALALQAFVTSFAWKTGSSADRLLERLPFRTIAQFRNQLTRRTLAHVPASCVRAHPAWEVLRSAAMLALNDPVTIDKIWDRGSHSFDAMVARRYVPKAEVIQCFEYTALAAFKRAKELGVARVLHLPSLDSLQFEEIRRRERSQWPELADVNDAYFDRMFERRYRRRREEIELADVVIANSSLTARSHIKAGADPKKVFAVPLGAPEAIEPSGIADNGRLLPLRVLWAGPFSLRKGAHYLLEGWRMLAPGTAARLDIYGTQMLPSRLCVADTAGITFHGSVPQHQLFQAFLQADVLVFPTLSDGFGMVVAEAFAHGLPVITTDQAGAADLVTPENGIIVPAADPRAIAEAMRWCLDNRIQLSEMRRHALATARERQWSHFRRDLIAALTAGLSQAGYNPDYAGVT